MRAVCLIVTEDLGKTKVSAKVVPKNLASDQKLTQVCVCEDWIENQDNVDKVHNETSIGFLNMIQKQA